METPFYENALNNIYNQFTITGRVNKKYKKMDGNKIFTEIVISSAIANNIKTNIKIYFFDNDLIDSSYVALNENDLCTIQGQIFMTKNDKVWLIGKDFTILNKTKKIDLSSFQTVRELHSPKSIKERGKETGEEWLEEDD